MADKKKGFDLINFDLDSDFDLDLDKEIILTDTEMELQMDLLDVDAKLESVINVFENIRESGLGCNLFETEAVVLSATAAAMKKINQIMKGYFEITDNEELPFQLSSSYEEE